jgi:hypothetical protein
MAKDLRFLNGVIDEAARPRSQLGRRHLDAGIAVVVARGETLANLFEFLLQLRIGRKFGLQR